MSIMHSSANQELFKNTSAIKVAIRIISSIMCCHQLNLFAVSKDEWITKEDTGKSINNAMYMAKGTYWAEVISTSVKIKPAALAIIVLHLSEHINQSISHSISRLVSQ